MMRVLLGAVSCFYFLLNTVFWCSLFYPIIIIKFLLPFKKVTTWAQHSFVFLAENWISTNTLFLKNFCRTQFLLNLPEKLNKDSSYLVISNHRSWVDIIALQYHLNHRIPFLRFFIKENLKWVPFLGVAWWALDYPMMKRKAKSGDLKTAQKACEKLHGIPASVLIFLEGTRFAPEKKKSDRYKNLLAPKTGGSLSVLNTLGNQIENIIDITIVYSSDQKISFMDLLFGNIDKILLEIKAIPIPEKYRSAEILMNQPLKKEFDQWIQDLWTEKDLRIEKIKSDRLLSQ